MHRTEKVSLSVFWNDVKIWWWWPKFSKSNFLQHLWKEGNSAFQNLLKQQRTVENIAIVSASCKVAWFSPFADWDHATMHEAEATVNFSTVQRYGSFILLPTFIISKSSLYNLERWNWEAARKLFGLAIFGHWNLLTIIYNALKDIRQWYCTKSNFLANWLAKRRSQSVVFNSNQKMAMITFYFINFHRTCGYVTA